MGRMIDADILIAELKESALHHCNNPREDSLLQRDRVIVRAQPTVEAIPKDQYEARLKADMVSMLEEIQLELDEMKITKVRSAGFAPYSKDPFRRGVNCSKEIIQQKIDKLKGNIK